MRMLLTLAATLALAGAASADTLIDAKTIEARIAATMAERLPAQGRYKVMLADPGFTLTLPDAAQGKFDIAGLTYDAPRKSFAAALAFTNANGEREYVRLGGAAGAVIALPVLARDVAAGETIQATDLATLDVAAERVNAQTLRETGAIAGQSARRMLRANTPLFAFDVKKQVLIKKGELVTVTYRVEGIELSTQGTAQADAGEGDAVMILNTRSRRTIEARVTGVGQAVVTAPNATLAAR